MAVAAGAWQRFFVLPATAGPPKELWVSLLEERWDWTPGPTHLEVVESTLSELGFDGLCKMGPSTCSNDFAHVVSFVLWQTWK